MLMRSFALAFTAGVFVACASTSVSNSIDKQVPPNSESECSQYYSAAKKDTSLFLGYGEGRVHEVAVDAARADLAKEISTEITASGQVQETEKDVGFTSVVQSRVNASLVDVRIAKKCVLGEKHEAIASLRRDMFLGAMRKALFTENEKGSAFVSRIRGAKGSQRSRLLLEAKEFLRATDYNDILKLCSRLGGCAAAPRDGIDTLSAMFDDKTIAEEAAQANMFRAEFVGDMARESQSQIIGLMREKGWVLDDSALASKIVRVQCSEVVFPKISGTEHQVLEITCRAVGNVEGVKQFDYTFVGKGVAANLEAARVLAKNQMREEKP